MDTNLRYLQINDWLATLNGISIEAHLGRTIREVIPDVAAGVEQQLRKVIETGEPILDGRVDAETPAHPRVVRNFQHHYYPNRSEDGKILGVSCVVADITDHKKADDALRQSEERYRTLVQTIPHGIQNIHASGIIVFANAAHHKQFKYGEGELIGMSILDLVVTDSEREELREYLKYLVNEQPPPVPYFGQNKTKQGSVIDVQVDWDYQRDDQGRVTGFTSVITNITQLKHTEESLYRSQRLASLGTLAAGIAHEINNPVGATLLAAQYALTHKNDPTGQAIAEKALRDIESNARRCGEIVGSILQFAGQHASERSLHDVNSIVQSAIKLTRKHAIENFALVSFESTDPLPTVLLNRTEMERVLVNLIRNAIESGTGKIRVTIRTECSTEKVCVTVSDNGRGITENQKKQLFDPFYTTRRDQGGIGFGLGLAHAIISSYGGTINVTSSPTGGTTFTVELPLPAHN